jgi:hypothetical protein
MQGLDFFTSARNLLKKVWRFMLPIFGVAAHFALSLLLRLRMTIRLLFPKKRNAFPGIQALEVPVFVINLAKRPDRLREVTENLVGIGFSDVRVFEAIDGPKKYPGLVRGHSANLGCTESHLRVISDNLKKGRPIAVCEDDNEFLASPKKIHDLIREFLDSPHFDVLGLSTRSRGPKVKVSPDLDLVSWALAPSFYIAKPRSRRQLMGAYHKSMSRLKAERRHGPFDQVWKTTQRLRLFFVRPTARVARQKESFSDIQDKFFAGT